MCYIDIRLNDKNEFYKDGNGNYIINGYSKYIPYYPYKMVYQGKITGSSLSAKGVKETQEMNLKPAVRVSVRTEEGYSHSKDRRQGFGKQDLRRAAEEKIKTQERPSVNKTERR